MALTIVVQKIPPFDGEYEFDDRNFTTRELRWIKQIAGYLPMKLDEGLEGGDADLIIALTVIAMARAGKISREEVLSVADRMADEPLDGAKIKFVGEADAGPPDPNPSMSTPPASSPTSSPGSRTSSGDRSETGSESPARIPAATGTGR